MNLVQRVKEILLQPASTWPVIEAEPATPQSLFVPYVLVLAAIPAIASFIGLSVLGMGMMGMSFKVPFGSGLNMAISTYVLSLVMVAFLGWLTSALAPTFGGKSDLISGLKCAVYASTPGFVAGAFNIFPMLSFISLLAGLYGLYLLYLGLPILMKNPKEKSPVYMVVLVIAAIVASVLISAVTRALMPSPSMGSLSGVPDGTISTPAGDVKVSPSTGAASGDAAMTIKTDKGEVKIDLAKPSADGTGVMTIKTAEGEVKIDTKKMEELAKQMEALAGKQSK